MMGKSLKGRIISTAAVLAAFASGATLSGCGGDDNGTTGAQFTAEQHVDFGWEFFEAGEYGLALEDFNLAIGKDAGLADAWNGVGWSLGKLVGRIDEAPAKFERALQADTARYDALGGWAFAAYKQGDWSGAITKCNSLLSRRPGWKFLHEQTLDKYDLHLLRAASYYNLGQFPESYAVVTGQLNTSFEADVTTSAGRRELSEEIERLRRVYG